MTEVCAGCAVRSPWEHRCHGAPCPCSECHPSPTQGEKQAEARANAMRLIKAYAYNAGESLERSEEVAHEIAAALSSPQEGATAVGADDVLRQLHGLAQFNLSDDSVQTIAENAAARIKALQRQVAELERVSDDASSLALQRKARAESAEASLRSLGDALERARADPLENDDAIKAALRAAGDYSPNGVPSAMQRPDMVVTAVRAYISALVPPTREPATPTYKAVKDAVKLADQQLRTLKEVAIKKATPSSPSDNDWLVDTAEAEYLAKHYPPEAATPRDRGGGG